MQIIDLHCDTITRFYKGCHLRDMTGGHINIEKLKKGGCMAQCFAIFTSGYDSRDITPQVYFDRAYARYLEEIKLNSDSILEARSAADIEKNHAAGKMSAVLTVEDGVTLNGKLENVDKYFELGVRMVALTWNYENSLGFPNNSDPELNAKGLKPFGIEAIRRMNKLGIAVDVSHLSEGGFWDVANITEKPFVASHSCAKALCGHSRNLTDAQLRALAEKGGVCGINYMSSFLHEPIGAESDNYTTTEQVIKHLVHMKNVAGIDTLAIGSDYDGIRSTLQWGDYAGTPNVVKAMEKAFTCDEIEKICYKNALRVFRDIIGK